MKHLLLSIVIGLSSVGAATDNALPEPSEAKATDEAVSRLDEAHTLFQQERYEESISALERLRVDIPVHPLTRLSLLIVYDLAANYERMFLRKLGTIEQQRENINKAIEYFEQIIRAVGLNTTFKDFLEKSTHSLKEAQQEKAEFELRHAASN